MNNIKFRLMKHFGSILKDNINSFDWDKMTKMNFFVRFSYQSVFVFVSLYLIHIIAHFITISLFSTKVNTIRKFSDKKHDVIVYTYTGKIFYFLLYTVFLLGLILLSGVNVASVLITIFFLMIIITFLIQGTIGNIVSGILLSFFQTYDVGDFVKINDVKGQVIDFRSINTIIENVSTNERITIPNAMIHKSKIVNYTKSSAYIYVIKIDVSNINKDFKKIIHVIYNFLINRDEFPYIKNTHGARPLIGVQKMGYGTIILLRIPLMSPESLFKYGSDLKTKIRQLLADHDIHLLDKDPILSTRQSIE